MRKGLRVDDYVAGVRSGDRTVLGRAITLVESNRGDHRRQAQELLTALQPFSGGAIRVGVSGVPGVGKSTLIDSLGLLLVERGHRVAVLAVDPTSDISGGSLLGDKTRMVQLAASDRVFIRPSPTGGSLGGVARKTRESIVVCEAAGHDVVLVETVGVGQTELDIMRLADTTLVVQVPEAGDAVQVMKAGLLEIADVFVVNKADREGAANTVRALQAMLDLGTAPRPVSHHGVSMAMGAPGSAGQAPASVPCWRPPVLQTVALEGKGIEQVVDAVARHQAHLTESGEGQTRRRARLAAELEAILRETLLRQLVTKLAPGAIAGLVDRVEARQIDPYTAVEQLLNHGLLNHG